MSLSTDQFIELLSGGRETRGVEFKAAGPRGDPLVFAFEARAILAMSNLQLGGWVLLGRRVRERRCCCLPRRARVRDDGQVACLYRVIPQLQVPLVARPATITTCSERSPVSGDLFAFVAALSIAARFPFSSILSAPWSGVRVMASIRPRSASLASVRVSAASRA